MLRAAVLQPRRGRTHSTAAEAFRHVVMQRHAAAAFDATRDVPEAILEDVMQLAARAVVVQHPALDAALLVRSAAQRELVGRPRSPSRTGGVSWTHHSQRSSARTRSLRTRSRA